MRLKLNDFTRRERDFSAALVNVSRTENNSVAKATDDDVDT